MAASCLRNIKAIHIYRIATRYPSRHVITNSSSFFSQPFLSPTFRQPSSFLDVIIRAFFWHVIITEVFCTYGVPFREKDHAEYVSTIHDKYVLYLCYICAIVVEWLIRNVTFIRVIYIRGKFVLVLRIQPMVDTFRCSLFLEASGCRKVLERKLTTIIVKSVWLMSLMVYIQELLSRVCD